MSHLPHQILLTVLLWLWASLYMHRILLWTSSAWSPGMRGFAASLVSISSHTASSLGAETPCSHHYSESLDFCAACIACYGSIEALVVLPAHTHKNLGERVNARCLYGFDSRHLMSDFNLAVFLLGSCPQKEIPALTYPFLGAGGEFCSFCLFFLKLVFVLWIK